MKPDYSKKKRFRRSKFDPYIVEIAKYLSMGMSVSEVAELIGYHFDDAVIPSALYSFMRSRGLHSSVTQGGTNLTYKAPCCNECGDCMVVTNTNNSKTMMCLPSKRMVSKTCLTSPEWCHKRPAENKR